MEDEIDDVPEASAGLIGQPSDPLQVLEVTPSEFRIQCQLNTEVSYVFTLRNISDRCAAFKVKTTAPRRYMVRPAQGTIPSGNAVPITIVLVKMSQYPDQSNPRNIRDKFLVQSFALENEMTGDELNTAWIAKEKEHNPRSNRRAYYEHRLKCRLLIPSEEPQVPSSSIPLSSRSTVAETSGSGLGIVVSPPLEVPIELSTPVTKTTPISEPTPSTNTPAEGATSSAYSANGQSPIREQPPKVDKGRLPEPVLNEKPSAQPGTNADTEEKCTPTSSRKKSDAPLLANHPKEYEKMLAYSVKLTVEREALESKLAKLSDHNSFLLKENERLRKTLAVQQENSATCAASSPLAGPEKKRSALDVIQMSDGNYEPLIEPDFDFSESHANLVASQLAASSGIQLWQVMAVAALCFLIGRIL